MNKCLQPWAVSKLFSAFEDAFHIHWQRPLRLQVRLQCFHMSEELSFVVAGPSAIKIVVLYGWLERRSTPLLQPLRRLDIIMSVDQKCGPCSRVLP